MKEIIKCEIHNLEYEATIYPQIGIITKCPECLKEMRERKKQEQELLLRDPSTFTSFKEFAIYGKAMGHKPGWAWHRAKAKGLIK